MGPNTPTTKAINWSNFLIKFMFTPPTAISTDEVTRDYTYGETDPLVKRCRLLPWINADLDDVSIVTTEPPDSYYEVKPNQLFCS